MSVYNYRIESLLQNIKDVRDQRNALLKENQAIKKQLDELKQSLEKVEINRNKDLASKNEKTIDALLGQIDECLLLLKDVSLEK